MGASPIPKLAMSPGVTFTSALTGGMARRNCGYLRHFMRARVIAMTPLDVAALFLEFWLPKLKGSFPDHFP